MSDAPRIDYRPLFAAVPEAQRPVLRCLLEFGPQTDTQVWQRLRRTSPSIRANQVAGARNRLACRVPALVVRVRTVTDRCTGRRVGLWAINGDGLAALRQAAKEVSDTNTQAGGRGGRPRRADHDNDVPNRLVRSSPAVPDGRQPPRPSGATPPGGESLFQEEL